MIAAIPVEFIWLTAIDAKAMAGIVAAAAE